MEDQIKDWIITLPKTMDWDTYQKEIADVADGRRSMFYKLPYLPKTMKPGDRCFVTWQSTVKGWMEIKSVGYRGGFRCQTTGASWPAGFYMERSGVFHEITNPLPEYKGFRGIREYNVSGIRYLQQSVHVIRTDKIDEEIEKLLNEKGKPHAPI